MSGCTLGEEFDIPAIVGFVSHPNQILQWRQASRVLVGITGGEKVVERAGDEIRIRFIRFDSSVSNAEVAEQPERTIEEPASGGMERGFDEEEPAAEDEAPMEAAEDDEEAPE